MDQLQSNNRSQGKHCSNKPDVLRDNHLGLNTTLVLEQVSSKVKAHRSTDKRHSYSRLITAHGSREVIPKGITSLQQAFTGMIPAP